MRIVGQPYMVKHEKNSKYTKVQIFANGKSYKLQLKKVTEEQLRGLVFDGDKTFWIGLNNSQVICFFKFNSSTKSNSQRLESCKNFAIQTKIIRLQKKRPFYNQPDI